MSIDKTDLAAMFLKNLLLTRSWLLTDGPEFPVIAGNDDLRNLTIEALDDLKTACDVLKERLEEENGS